MLSLLTLVCMLLRGKFTALVLVRRAGENLIPFPTQELGEQDTHDCSSGSPVCEHTSHELSLLEEQPSEGS